ncbi:DNA-binding protein [Microbulbifer sp. OS29]|uniref:DNA-binding protein n=1 Tax=Microbulbifer okhotskensis TaxID=2926617 RepID=A0A9X2ENX5_9GAMM|nr:DNA-binding protein [Microbulbifer okhotskensis]MCO1335065.1 DNA-binding protein [Microbulbifer okhotskensis]
MARTGVTYLDVFEAAKAIKARGEEPTVDKVRTLLGTGSKSTIAPLLKRWKSETASNTDVSGLPKDLVEALKGLHQRIQKGANQQIEQVQQEFGALEAELSENLTEAQETSVKQAAQIRELEQKLSSAESEKRRLKVALDESRSVLEKCKYQLEDSSARVSEQKTAIEEMKQENRDIREHFEHFQQRTATDRQHERDQYRSSSDQLKGQVTSLSEQLGLAERKLSDQDLLYKQGQALITELNREKQDLRQQIGVALTEASNLKLQTEKQVEMAQTRSAEISQLQGEFAQLQNDSSAKEREIQLQQLSLEKLESELVTMKDLAERLSDENRMALQEKAMLQGRFTQLESSLKRRQDL